MKGKVIGMEVGNIILKLIALVIVAIGVTLIF